MLFKLYESDGITVAEFTGGTLDAGSSLDAIGKQLYELVDRRGCGRIVLDLSNVHFLSSSALGVIMVLKHKLDYRRGRLAICGVSDTLRQVFRFAGLTQQLEFYPSSEAALASFGPMVA